MDQTDPESGPLPSLPHPERRDPNSRDQVKPRQFGQHPSVDPIRLRRQRSDPLYPESISHHHQPARIGEKAIDKPGAVHRLDDTTNQFVDTNPIDEPAQTRTIRTNRKMIDLLTGLGEDSHHQRRSGKIQTCMQHEGASFLAVLRVTTRRLPPEAPS
jgi:hypothetical protein